jgi:putative acetyltransferase
MSPNDITLRSEVPGDEDAIDVVVCRAFGSMDEANLVRLLRTCCPTFDPGDQMVGHTLFTPADVRLMGRTTRVLAVAPVAVVPERQRQGIGGKMLRYGQELGKLEGYAFAFLCGHPSYYPRFGYKPCFGFASVIIKPDLLPAPAQPLSPWPVQPMDIPWLIECFAAEWSEVDFSWQWGSCLSEWTLVGANALIWRTQDGRRAAYTLGWPGRKRWKMVLADDPALARDAIATIRPESLEHHPSGWLARNVLEPAWSTVTVTPHPAAMACELQDGILQPYLTAVAAGHRPIGACPYPLPFLPFMVVERGESHGNRSGI